MFTDQIVFEDKNEEFGFTGLPNVVLTSTVLNPTEVRIYGILRRYACMPKGAMPSVLTICMEANISKATYNRAIKKFIKSVDNPFPEVPLVTAIHRKNQTNVFKIHKLNDQLIEKLQPAIAMEKTDYKQLKNNRRKKGKIQNESAMEKTSGYQNETPGRLKMRPQDVSNCDTSNIDISNIEQQQENIVSVQSELEKPGNNKQQEQRQKENVVVVQNEFKNAFKKTISKKQAENLLILSEKHNKNVLDAIQETVAYYDQSRKEKKNPYGAVYWAITNGWDLDATKVEHQPSHPSHVEFDDTYFEKLFGGEK